MYITDSRCVRWDPGQKMVVYELDVTNQQARHHDLTTATELQAKKTSMRVPLDSHLTACCLGYGPSPFAIQQKQRVVLKSRMKTSGSLR